MCKLLFWNYFSFDQPVCCIEKKWQRGSTGKSPICPSAGLKECVISEQSWSKASPHRRGPCLQGPAARGPSVVTGRGQTMSLCRENTQENPTCFSLSHKSQGTCGPHLRYPLSALWVERRSKVGWVGLGLAEHLLYGEIKSGAFYKWSTDPLIIHCLIRKQWIFWDASMSFV